ncbi:MAG: ComF family protein [Coriobacteriaceae bacterium]|nr:ComF family protein [Coriobacteriaceae bacterium]
MGCDDPGRERSDLWRGPGKSPARGPEPCASAAPPGATAASLLARAGAALRHHALEALSPTRCAGCERPGALICDACLRALTLIDPLDSCVRCGAPFGSMLCTECRGEGGPCDRVLAGCVFEGPAPRIVRAYKDAGERRLDALIAQLMLDTAEHAEAEAAERYGGILEADAIVFVPATAEAFRRRGFDHMEEIARELSSLSGIPLVDALVKHGRGDQRALGRSGRLEASKGRYEVVAPITGMRILLVDDVITTGATLGAAGGALRGAGASAVDGLALARVW